MKIWVNGNTRDMTDEEIAEMQARELENTGVNELTDEDKLHLFLQSIPTEATPTVEPKVGYKWQAVYSGAAGFAWELVEDPNALGTMNNPLVWLPGASVKMGYHYTSGGKTYLALDDGTPSAITDEAFFAEI
jgi:hypothetical protein